MDDIEVKDAIEGIIETFGMSGKKAAEVMNMPYSSLRKKKLGVQYYHFTEDNLAALIHFIKFEASKLQEMI